MGPTQVFYSTYARVLTGATALVAVLAIWAVATNDGVLEATRVGAVAVTVVYAIWLAFWAPRVVVSDGGVDVYNIARSTHVPWPALREATVRWSLEVRTTTGTVTAWSAPKASAFRARATRPSRSSGEAVAEAIADRRAALRKAGYLNKAGKKGQPTATTTWNRWQLGVLGVLVAATIALWVL